MRGWTLEIAVHFIYCGVEIEQTHLNWYEHQICSNWSHNKMERKHVDFIFQAILLEFINFHNKP